MLVCVYVRVHEQESACLCAHVIKDLLFTYSCTQCVIENLLLSVSCPLPQFKTDHQACDDSIRGGQRSKCPKMLLFLIEIMFQLYNQIIHEVWGQTDHPSCLDKNPVQILALSFQITGHHAPSRTSFHPKTRQEDFLYDTKSSWVSQRIW